jgi:hypothetical protein
VSRFARGCHSAGTAESENPSDLALLEQGACGVLRVESREQVERGAERAGLKRLLSAFQ